MEMKFLASNQKMTKYNTLVFVSNVFDNIIPSHWTTYASDQCSQQIYWVSDLFSYLNQNKLQAY